MEVLSGLRVARVPVTLPCESTRIGAHLAGGASGRNNSVVDAFASFIFAASSIRASLRLSASSSISRSVGNIDLAAAWGFVATGSVLGTAAFRASSTPMPAPESRLRIAVASLSGTPTSMAFFSENVVRSSGARYLFTLSASVTAAIVSASSPRPDVLAASPDELGEGAVRRGSRAKSTARERGKQWRCRRWIGAFDPERGGTPSRGGCARRRARRASHGV